MKNYKLLALSSLVLSIIPTDAAIFDIKLNLKIGVQTCTGGEKVDCKQVINAIGETVKIPLSELTIQPLDLTQANQDLRIPLTVGTRTAYSFVPSTGELAGKTIYLVFDNVVQRPGSQHFGKVIIKVYRHIKGVDAERTWLEVGNISLENISLPFEVSSDATFKTGQSTFNLGRTLTKK